MRDLKKGSVIEVGDIRAIRPGNGVSPKLTDTIIGKTLIADVERGDPVLVDVFPG
jgi:sialic acid synthase SpsE